MEVLEFKYITTDSINDQEKFEDKYAWSRCYEYPMVLEYMNEFLNEDSLIHNSSWGFAGIHVVFKEEIDKLYKNAVHSDIRKSNLKGTFVYNIRQAPPPKLHEKYDCVLNVSTLEEVGGDHCEIFHNLFKQVKKGGLMICTFDMPGLQLEKIESMFDRKIDQSGELLNGENSIIRNDKYKHLNCGIFVVRK